MSEKKLKGYQIYGDAVSAALVRITSVTFVWLLGIATLLSWPNFYFWGHFSFVWLALFAFLLLVNFEYAERTTEFQRPSRLSPRAKTLERIAINSIPIFMLSEAPISYLAFIFIPFTLESVLVMLLESIVTAAIFSVVMVLPYLILAKVRSMRTAPPH